MIVSLASVARWLTYDWFLRAHLSPPILRHTDLLGNLTSLLQANSYFAYGAVFSLPRASAVKMPSAAKAAQTSRAMWKLLTNVFCSPLMLVKGRLCACDDDKIV